MRRREGNGDVRVKKRRRSGAIGPGQTSPGSGVSARTSTFSPATRRMFSLAPAGKLGWVPLVNGAFPPVL